NESPNRSNGDEHTAPGAGVLFDRRSVSAHRSQASRPPVLGEPVPVSQSREEPVRQPGLPAARDRAHHARKAPAVHGEVHDRGRPPEDRGVPPVGGSQAGGPQGSGRGDRQGSSRRAESGARHSGRQRIAPCPSSLTRTEGRPGRPPSPS